MKRSNGTVQEFIPIRSLRHGIIETTDQRYIKILEIEPINFMLRSAEEKGGNHIFLFELAQGCARQGAVQEHSKARRLP